MEASVIRHQGEGSCPTWGLQLQNGFTTIKAEGESDVTANKRPDSLSLKSCKTTRKKWWVIVMDHSLLWVSEDIRLSTWPRLTEVFLERFFLLATVQDPGCCGGTVKTCPALWLLPPAVIPCGHKRYRLGNMGNIKSRLQSLDKMSSRGPFQSQAFCDSVKEACSALVHSAALQS